MDKSVALALIGTLLAISVSGEFQVEKVVMQSKNAENGGYFYDFTDDNPENKMNIFWTPPNLDEPLDIASEINIHLDGNLLLESIFVGEQEITTCHEPLPNNCMFVWEKKNHTAILSIPHDSKNYSVYLANYKVDVKSFEEHTASMEFQLEPIKYCLDKIEISVDDIDDEQCKIVVTGGGCDTKVNRMPDIQVHIEDINNENIVAPKSIEYVQSPEGGDENGLFKVVQGDGHELEINDNTPANPKLVYRYQEGAKESKVVSEVNLTSHFAATGCSDMKTFCSGQSGDLWPAFPFPENFDSQLTCELSNYNTTASKCRSNNIVAAKGTQRATLKFTCPSKCSKGSWTGEGDPIDDTEKIFSCNEETNTWEEDSKNMGRWPTCTCNEETSSAMDVTMNVGLALLAMSLLKFVM